ncbi:hypothetical protein AVEN_272376-1 [Araneus ventricosus]|uniref:Uncharacterized protein n=1 Tax=Araneus ventricosus TaxID=182803 RepID=A0A4Y2I0E5_ARAVE|nr:hypothetical protein AVEN_272376-1 [Araneus ventricosus]
MAKAQIIIAPSVELDPPIPENENLDRVWGWFRGIFSIPRQMTESNLQGIYHQLEGTECFFGIRGLSDRPHLRAIINCYRGVHLSHPTQGL